MLREKKKVKPLWGGKTSERPWSRHSTMLGIKNLFSCLEHNRIDLGSLGGIFGDRLMLSVETLMKRRKRRQTHKNAQVKRNVRVRFKHLLLYQRMGTGHAIEERCNHSFLISLEKVAHNVYTGF